MKQVTPLLIDRMPKVWSIAVGAILLTQAVILVGVLSDSSRAIEPVLCQALVLGVFVCLMFMVRPWRGVPRKGTVTLSWAVATMFGGGLWSVLAWHTAISGNAGWQDPIAWSAMLYAVFAPLLLLHRQASLVAFFVGEFTVLSVGLAYAEVAPLASEWLYAFAVARTAVAAGLALVIAGDARTSADGTVRERPGSVAGSQSIQHSAGAGRARAFAEVADGLRAPVHAVIRAAQALVSMPGGSERRAVVQVQEASAAMAGAVNALKELAMVEVDRRQLRRQKTPIGTVASRVCAALSARAKRKGLVLTVEVDDAWVLTDAASLHSILLILIANALHYTDSGWVRIRSYVSGDTLELIVQDSGRGIALSEQSRIFEPFFRGTNVREGEFGSGLGLALANLLASKAQLTLRVESTPGVGTSFSLRLPLASQPSGNAVVTAAGLHSAGSSLAGGRVLVNVANPELSDRLMRDLRAWGMEVRGATSVYEMMNVLIEGYSPDVLVVSPPLDGGANGRDILASLRSLVQIATTPILIIQPPEEPPIRIRKSDQGIRSVRLDAVCSVRLKNALIDLLFAPPDTASFFAPSGDSKGERNMLCSGIQPEKAVADVTRH